MVVKMVVRRSWRHNRSIPSQQRCMAAAAAVRPWLWAVAPGSGAARDQEWRPTALCTRCKGCEQSPQLLVVTNVGLPHGTQ